VRNLLERSAPKRPDVLPVAGLAIAYLAAAKVGLELSVAQGVVTPVWAPTGIALAALILLGVRLWPGVLLGAFLANVTSGASLAESAAISAGNTAEAVVGAVLLVRVGLRPQLDRVRDVLALIVLGAMAAPAISATNGVTTLLVSGDVAATDYASRWLLWWSGDAMGALVVAPLLLVWATTRRARLSGARALEAATLVAFLVGVSVVVFVAGLWKYPHLLFPFLIWAPLRFRQHGAVTASFIVTAIAIAGAVVGTTPIGGESSTVIVQMLEGLLAAVVVTTLLLGAVLSERQKTGEDLERAAAGLAEAQALAHVGSWEWDIPANRVTWSDELFRLYGLEPRSVEVTFEAYLERVHPEDRDRAAEIVRGAYTTREPFEFDHRLVRPDGSVRWSHSRGQVIADESGEPVRMLGTAQDVTERKRLDELRDNILAAVSHELRTPLTAIRGFALTLQSRDLDPATRSQAVDHIAEQAVKLERLLGDLLDIDRLRHGRVQPRFERTNVGELAERVAREYADDGRTIEVAAAPVVAHVDPAKVERIVDNLLTNALKHTPPGTPIRVRVAEARDEGVLLAVDDRGAGIPEQDRDSIFEIFNRGSTAAGHAAGTGVGLALVAQFASLHGGRAWVEDNAEGGASFCVQLPRARQPAAREAT
jgi:PAS domain S-box-containing protein